MLSPLSYTVRPTLNGAPDNTGICSNHRVVAMLTQSFFLYVFSGKVSYCNHRSSGRNHWRCTGRCTRCTSASSSRSSSGKFKIDT